MTHPSSAAHLRQRNRSAILRAIFRQERISRTRLAAETKLTTMAVTRIVRELAELGLVEEGEKTARNGQPGRRQTEISLAADGAYVVGVKIHVLERTVVIANLRGDLLHEAKLATIAAPDNDTAASKLADAIDEILESQHVDRSRILGVGVAAAGTVDPSTGALHPSPYIGGGDVEIRGALGSKLGVPVIVENSNTALALAETRFGAWRGRNSLMLVQVAAGLGGSILVNGQPIRGATNAAGQIGHLPVPGADRLCSCGRIGCLNTVASGWAVLADLGLTTALTLQRDDVDTAAARLDQLTAQAVAGDLRVANAFRAAGSRLGEALVALWVALDPDALVLTGPVAELPAYLDGIQDGWRRAGLEPPGDTRFGVAHRDPAEAAALLAIDAFALSPRLDIERLSRARRASGATVLEVQPVSDFTAGSHLEFEDTQPG